MSDLTNRNPALRLLGKIHGRAVHGRRIAVLADRLAASLTAGSRLLDVGCGDGRLGALLRDAVPELAVQGVEVLPRADCAVPCKSFDGIHLPFADGSVDCCLFVDVLHHTTDPLPLLQDACRVSSQFLLIKDHVAENALDHATLRLMDWVGNGPHGVALPYNYLSRSKWQNLYSQLGLTVVRTDNAIPLYPFPFSAVFGRNLHFISLLKKAV
jgi:SAM-dependent methyltransferase